MKAFEITTKNGVLCPLTFLVIADSYGEAEDVFLMKYSYKEIVSIRIKEYENIIIKTD